MSLLFTQFEGFPQLSSRDCVCEKCAALCLPDRQIDIAGDLLSNFDDSKTIAKVTLSALHTLEIDGYFMYKDIISSFEDAIRETNTCLDSNSLKKKVLCCRGYFEKLLDSIDKYRIHVCPRKHGYMIYDETFFTQRVLQLCTERSLRLGQHHLQPRTFLI